MMLPAILLASVFVLLAVAGVFSGMETVFTSASYTFLQKRAREGDERAQLAQSILQRSERFLGTTLVGTNLAIVSATTLTHLLLGRLHPPPHWQSFINALLVTPLVLVVGEFLPKSLGRAYADKLSLRLAHLLRTAIWILWPAVTITESLASLLARVTGTATDSGPDTYVTREDLRAVAELALEQGLVPGTTGSMLCTVFELNSKPVSAVMVPLVDVASVPLNARVQDVEALSSRTGFSRFPVYDNRIDDVVGIVDLRELLYAMTPPTADAAGSDPDTTVAGFVHSGIVYVPKTKPVGTLLHELRYQKTPMAVVVDEHGGVVGILTIEDLIEEVVGEIHDERDRPGQKVQKIADSVHECDGKLEIQALTEQLPLTVDAKGFETVAGLVLWIAGRIPAEGERFRYGEYEIEVLEVTRRRVARVRFRKLPNA